jgi:ribosomal protein S18 acetylase RimI-like enzyme
MPEAPVDNSGFRIRDFLPQDAQACLRLYVEGLIGGSLSPNDTALDVDDIHKAYMSDSGSHFWVAEAPGPQVVGMIGVQAQEEHACEIRRLRVALTHRGQGIGTRLVQTAVEFCHDRGYLKVALDTYIERDSAVALFDKLGFRLSRTWEVGGKQVLQFYLDLYHQPRPAAGGGDQAR